MSVRPVDAPRMRGFAPLTLACGTEVARQDIERSAERHRA